MKKMFIFFTLFIQTLNSNGQDTSKYTAGIAGGWLTTIAERGPKHTTEVGDVQFLHPMSANGYAYFDMHMHNKLWIGIELGLDQFDFGYLGNAFYDYEGLSSGLLTSHTYVYLYKAGIRARYDIPLSKRFSLQTVLNPAIGYYRYNEKNDDTARTNAQMHNVRSPGSNKIQYIRYPAWQKEGLHFTMKATVMIAWRVSRRLALTADLAYQQGFTNFLVDNVSIRQYQPGTLRKFEHLYYTKVNGTSFQYHLGLQFRFGKAD